MQFRAFAIAGLLSSALAAPQIDILARDTTPPTTSPGWSIKKFSRNCTDPNICTYYIFIDLGDGNDPHRCTITDTAMPATTHPFYNKSCAEGVDFLISWGWDYNGDFTVMTVVQAKTQLEAFFGYSHPNAPLFFNPPQPIISYADVGPNAVQHT